MRASALPCCCFVALIVPVALVLPIEHSCALVPLPAVGIAFLGRRCCMVDCRLHSCVIASDIIGEWYHCWEVGRWARRVRRGPCRAHQGLDRAVGWRPVTPRQFRTLSCPGLPQLSEGCPAKAKVAWLLQPPRQLRQHAAGPPCQYLRCQAAWWQGLQNQVRVCQSRLGN